MEWFVISVNRSVSSITDITEAMLVPNGVLIRSRRSEKDKDHGLTRGISESMVYIPGQFNLIGRTAVQRYLDNDKVVATHELVSGGGYD